MLRSIMKCLLALFLSFHAYALPQEVLVDLDKVQSTLRVQSSAMDATGTEFSFKVQLMNAGQTPIMLESLELLVNGSNASQIPLNKPRISLQHLDSHTIRLMGMRYSHLDKPKFFQFNLHATGKNGEKILRSSKVYLE